MGDRLPTPEELWGPDYRENLQKQFDEYDAAVAREQAEIEARRTGKPLPPDPLIAGGVLEPAKQGEELQRVASFATQEPDSPIRNSAAPNAVRKVSLDPADYPPLPVLDPLPEKEPRRKRELRGPKVIMEPPPEAQYLVQGLFAASSLNLLVGDPGHKKSILAIDLALSVAMGKPWLGQTVGSLSDFYPPPAPTVGAQPPSRAARGNAAPVSPEGRDSSNELAHSLPLSRGRAGDGVGSGVPVILVEEESGLQRLLKRLHSAFLGHGANEETPFHFISMGNYDFRDVDEAIDLSEHAHSVDARLIVIDALADVMVGGDENSVLSTQPILRNLRALAIDCDAAVVIVHHNNKSGAFRGSTTLQAGVDHMLSVYSPPGQNLIRLSTLKSRDLEPITLHARAHFEPDRFWLEATDEKFSPPLSPRHQMVVDYFEEHGESTTQQLMADLDFTSNAMKKAIHLLKASGHIKRVDAGKQGQIATYDLSTRLEGLDKHVPTP